jgi:hypothetical protein
LRRTANRVGVGGLIGFKYLHLVAGAAVGVGCHVFEEALLDCIDVFIIVPIDD